MYISKYVFYNTRSRLSIRHQEIDDTFLYLDGVTPHGRGDKPAVHSHWGIGSLLYDYLAGAIGMHAAMVEELTPPNR